MNTNIELLKASTFSNPNSIAGAISDAVERDGKVEVQAIGAGALNQAVKAVAIARGYVAPHGIDLACIPAFVNLDLNGEPTTAMKLIVSPR